MNKEDLEIIDVEIIHLSEEDQGAIILLKKHSKKIEQDVYKLKSLLMEKFPDKKFVIIFGENIEVIKI